MNQKAVRDKMAEKELTDLYKDLLNKILAVFNKKGYLRNRGNPIKEVNFESTISDYYNFLEGVYLCKKFFTSYNTWFKSSLGTEHFDRLLVLYMKGWISLELMLKKHNKKPNNKNNYKLILLVLLMLTDSNTKQDDQGLYWNRTRLFEVLDKLRTHRNDIVHGGLYTKISQKDATDYKNVISDIKNNIMTLKRILEMILLRFSAYEPNQKESVKIISPEKFWQQFEEMCKYFIPFDAPKSKYQGIINSKIYRWLGGLDRKGLNSYDIKGRIIGIDTFGGLFFRVDHRISYFESFYDTQIDETKETSVTKRDLIIPENSVYTKIVNHIEETLKELNRKAQNKPLDKNRVKKGGNTREPAILYINKASNPIVLSLGYLVRSLDIYKTLELLVLLQYKDISKNDDKEELEEIYKTVIIPINSTYNEIHQNNLKDDMTNKNLEFEWKEIQTTKNSNEIEEITVVWIKNQDPSEFFKKERDNVNLKIYQLQIFSTDKEKQDYQIKNKEMLVQILRLLIQKLEKESNSFHSSDKRLKLSIFGMPHAGVILLGYILAKKGYEITYYEYGKKKPCEKDKTFIKTLTLD